MQDLLPIKSLFSTVKTKRRKSYEDIDRYYSLFKYISKTTYQFFNHKSHIVIRLCHKYQGIIYHRYKVAKISCIYCAFFAKISSAIKNSWLCPWAYSLELIYIYMIQLSTMSLCNIYLKSGDNINEVIFMTVSKCTSMFILKMHV